MMAEYIEREAAKEAAMDACEFYPSECEMIGCAVDKIPAADVAQVVRCKDCENTTTYKNRLMCYIWEQQVTENDFCSRGERKEK